MRALILLAAASTVMLAGCSTVGAGSDDAMAAAMSGNATPTNRTGYVEMAASSDMYEVQSSQLALSRAQNAQMRQFAEMMVRDHTNTSQQLTAAATASGMPPMTPQMMPMHAEMIAALQARNGAEFDREYARQQLLAHQMAVALHTNFAARGDTPALQSVARAAVPIVTNHLNMVRQWPKQ